MKSFYTGLEWMNGQLPEGLSYPAKTIITGPGGAGKPLIGAMIVNAWLKANGTLIHFLINFDRTYADYLFEHFNPVFNQYKKRIAYIAFDPLVETVEQTDPDTICANLLKPDHFDSAVRLARSILPETQAPPLIYGSALNMLLFSKTYGQLIHHRISDLMRTRDAHTLFTISNNYFEEQALEWENLADHLFFVHGTGIMQLSLKVSKLNGKAYRSEEIKVPLSEAELYAIRQEADKSRKKLIPIIRRT